MNGYDVSKYEYVKKKAETLKLKIVPKSEVLYLYTKTGSNRGVFPNVDELYGFLCGYEWGIHKVASINKDKEN